MQDTYLVQQVVKTIGTSGSVEQTDVQLQNNTNTWGPSQLHVTIAGDFTVKPGDTHVVSIA